MLKFSIEINREDKRDKEFIEQDMYYVLMRLNEIRSRKEELNEIRSRKEELEEIISDEEKTEADFIKLTREFWEVI